MAQDERKADRLTLAVNGTELHFQAVNYVTVRHLERRYFDLATRSADESLSDEERSRYRQETAALGERFFTFLAGWGIQNRVPEVALRELEAIGLASDSPYVNRANWVRYLLTQTDEERSQVIAKVRLATELAHRARRASDE